MRCVWRHPACGFRQPLHHVNHVGFTMMGSEASSGCRLKHMAMQRLAQDPNCVDAICLPNTRCLFQSGVHLMHTCEHTHTKRENSLSHKDTDTGRHKQIERHRYRQSHGYVWSPRGHLVLRECCHAIAGQAKALKAQLHSLGRQIIDREQPTMHEQTFK